MKTLRLLVLPLLIVGAVVALAQEETESTDAEKTPFEFKASGETVEDFKLEFTANYKVDQSSPVELVKSYAAYSDNRESMRVAMESVGEKWDAAVQNSLASEEKKLLTEEAFKALHTEEEEEEGYTYKRVNDALAPNGTVEEGEGFVWVEAVQKAEVTEENWETGELETRTDEEKLRFKCVKGEDGKFRIDECEQWAEDWENADDMGNAPMAWIEETTMYAFLLFMMAGEKDKKEIPAIKQGTPKEAALSLFGSLVPRSESYSSMITSKGMDKWVDLIAGMFTERYKKAQEEKMEEWGGEESEPAAREIESVEEADGVATVKFKAQNEWSGSVELQLKKVGEVWKIHKAGYYEMAFDTDGNQVWKYKEEPDIYSYSYR